MPALIRRVEELEARAGVGLGVEPVTAIALVGVSPLADVPDVVAVCRVGIDRHFHMQNLTQCNRSVD